MPYKDETGLYKSLFNEAGGIISNVSSIKKLDQYIQLVRILTNEWETTWPWFRGVSRASYSLVPSIYRASSWKYDTKIAREMIDEFIRYARQLLPQISYDYNRWGWYQIMRHHGLPTRLLDWTYASKTALYFALRNLEDINNPCVWVLNPFTLNTASRGKPNVLYTDPVIQSKDDLYIEKYLDSDNKLPGLPIAVGPAHINPRITAQRGCFTVHGSKREGIDQLVNNKKSKGIRLAKLYISDDYVEDIRKDLMISGVTEAILFPDLDGLAREICCTYGCQ